MRKILLILFVLPFYFNLFAQEGSVKGNLSGTEKAGIEQEQQVNIKIFPVPVFEGRFTITSDRAFISVRMTNIIGQEIIRERFYDPRTRTEVIFQGAEKGIYLVTLEFEDKTKIVKKILVDSSR
jgi:hypothetical protein